jgi:hypothetical protein
LKPEGSSETTRDYNSAVKGKSPAIGVSQYKNKEFMVMGGHGNPAKAQLAPSLRGRALADSPEACFYQMP